MGIFSKKEIKEDGKFVTIREQYNLTENVKVADVKQYLKDEYRRAYERESTIKRLENTICGLEETKLKYDAMLVISDENRNRLLDSEETIKSLKNIISISKEDNKALKNSNNNIELNYINKLKDKDNEIKLLKKEVSGLKKDTKAKK